MIFNKKTLFGIILCFFSISINAQNDPNQSLRSIISELEDRHEVSFTYLDEDIDNVYLPPPPVDADLNEIIDYLQNQTDLVFQILNDRFITLSKKLESSIDVCGVLIDEKTGHQINGATIQTGRKITVSDENGYFQLQELRVRDTLLVRFLGYDYLRKPVNDMPKESCDTLRLRQQVKKLKELVITNFITQGIDKNAEGEYLISSEELGILPGLTEPDVLQTIQALPGILSIDETVSDINVRGGTNDQNLILWNGIRMYQSGHFFGLISAFNPFISKDVGLIKNGSSAYYGDAVSSTVNIETDNQVRQKFSGSAGVNMINADINVVVPLFKKSSLQISSRRSIADILQTPTYKSYFDRVFRNTEVKNPLDSPDSLINSNEKFKFYDLSLNYNYRISNKDKIEMSLLHLYNDVEYQENAKINNELISKTSGLEQKSLAAGLIYSRFWNEKIRTRAHFYFSYYFLGAVNFDILNDQRLIQENEVLEKGMKIDARFVLSDKMDLFGGYQLSEIGIGNLVDINNPIFRRYIKRVLINHAIFADANYRSRSGKTSLRGGFRMNYVPELNEWIPEPRLAFNQRFLNHFSVELLGEFKSQSTTQIIDLQNEFLGVEKRRWALSNNEDIPIIKSRQISTGIHYQKSDILISLEGYLKNVKGITSSSQGFQNQYQYIRSAGNYDVVGMDFLINKRFWKVTSWLSYSLARNEYYFPEFTPSEFPNNFDIRHAISFGISYQSSKFQASAGINWRTGKPYTTPFGLEEDEIIYSLANTSRLDDYLRFDLSAMYNIKFNDKISGEIGASIWNLINTQNILNVYYQSDNKGGIDEIQQYALSITPNLMFRINF